jgi:hypothetical protein
MDILRFPLYIGPLKYGTNLHFPEQAWGLTASPHRGHSCILSMEKFANMINENLFLLV